MTIFIDKVRIYLKAGSGGNGCLSFRREKYVPYGGPDGGNGGKGGDIYLKAHSNLATLIDFTYRPHYHAQGGHPGLGKNKYGAAGEDMVIDLPCGTVVYKNGDFFKDLSEPGEKILVATGGRGGRGNASFKTSRQNAPRIAEKGQPGESAVLDLELKTIADIGLVGFPNAGKSTFLARVTKARPKIADYPFTTISPNLGAVSHKGKSFIIADIPGIIEDAHLGKGLGIEFLRHVERTKILIHLVDLFGFENKKAFENWKTIVNELKEYGHDVDKKPYIVALNKTDIEGWEEKHREFEHTLKKFANVKKTKTLFPVIPVSAVSGAGLNSLLDKIINILSKEETKKKEAMPGKNTFARYTFEPEFEVDLKEGIFVVSGKKIEDLAAMTNFSQEQAVGRFQHILKKMGVEDALIKRGIKKGQTVKIGAFEFDFQ